MNWQFTITSEMPQVLRYMLKEYTKHWIVIYFYLRNNVIYMNHFSIQSHHSKVSVFHADRLFSDKVTIYFNLFRVGMKNWIRRKQEK